MRATDLMIGDYILVDTGDEEPFTDYICDIGYVPQWNEMGVRTCQCGEEWLRESEIMPLPLTNEILEKNEFKKYSSCEYIIFDDIIWYNGGLYIYDKKKIFFDIPECKYVHQLQHILKLCNIYKEIIV